MKRAVLYAMASGDDGRKEPVGSAEQLGMSREYAEEHGYAIVAELSDDETRASGADITLPQMAQAIEMAEAGRFDALVVSEMSRLGSLARQLVVKEKFAVRGIEVVCVMPSLEMLVGDPLAELRSLAGQQDWLMVARVECGACGGTMHGGEELRPEPQAPRPYYSCSRCDDTRTDHGRFRADYVDTLVWDWVRTLLSDPSTLRAWWRYGDERLDINDTENYAERQRAAAYLAERLHRTQALLPLLPELHHMGVFSKQQYANRSAALEQEVSDSQRELDSLHAKLAGRAYVARDEDTYNQYVRAVAASLDAVESSPEARRRLIELLDVRVKLEEGYYEKTARVWCVLGSGELQLPSDGAERWIGQRTGGVGADPSLEVPVSPISHVERLRTLIPGLHLLPDEPPAARSHEGIPM